MLKRPENASDPRANVMGKLHKALRHSALSTIISPSYVIGCIPPVIIQRQQQNHVQNTPYDELKLFLNDGCSQPHSLNDTQRRLLQLRSKIEDKDISHFIPEMEVETTDSHHDTIGIRRQVSENQAIDFMEIEDMDSVVAIASHSRLTLENQSDMVMEEGPQGISEAHQVSDMDVQMADASENVQHEDTPVTDNMPELKPSSPAAGSLQVQDEISHHHDANGYMNASHTIEFVVEAITAEPPQNDQESIEEATETACLDNVLDHKSLESNNRFSQQEPAIDRAAGPEQEGQSSSVQEQGDSQMFAVEVIKDYGATDSVQSLEDDNRHYPSSIGNMRQTESYPSAPEKLLPNDTIPKSIETQYADLASNQSSYAFRYSPSIVVLPESEQQEMVSASGPKVSTPESDHEDIAPASVLAPMSPELECKNIATATAPRILSPQSKHEDIAPMLIQTAMASDLKQEEIATAPALPASSPESKLEDITPNSASPVSSSELVHEEMAATVDLPSSSSEPEHEYEESKDSVMEHDEDTHENVSVDIDIFSSDDDVTTWKEQRDEALAKLRGFITSLIQTENEFTQEKRADMKDVHNILKRLSGDTSMFELESDQLLFSKKATKRISALVRKANKFNQLPKVEGEDLSWVLKKLVKNVRKGWMAIPVQYHSSQGSFVPHGVEDINMHSLEHGVDGTLTIFNILTSTKLDKKLYAEEVITSCLNFTKMLLADVVSPAYDSWNNAVSNAEINELTHGHNQRRQMISKFSLYLSRIFSQLYRFIQQEDISDDMVITISYLSIPPFFLQSESLVENATISAQGQHQAGDNPIDEIKASAMDVLRCVFSKYPKHRKWILDEVLASVVHVPTDSDVENRYRIASGKSIHAISALMLQIVQCCTDTDRSSERSWTQKWELKHQKNNDKVAKLDESLIKKVMATSTAGIESCTQTSHALLQQLLTKSLKQSSEDQSSAEYRRILDMLISDAMEVLDEPEWPAAEVVIRVLSTILMAMMDDASSDVQKRNLSIEFIGIIAGRVYNAGSTKVEPNGHSEGNDPSESDSLTYGDLNNVPSTSSESNTPKAVAMESHHKVILNYLSSRISIDIISKSAIHFYLCQWGYTFSSLWKANTKREHADMENATVEEQENRMVYAHTKFIWDLLMEENLSGTSFDLSPHDRKEVKLSLEKLMFERPLYQSYQAMLSRIFTALEIESVSTRAVALRALINLSAKDVSFMEKQLVRVAIVRRMQDISPSVRDAAIKLAGNYLASHPEGTPKYLDAISERILDTSISVRKRVMRILKNVYVNINDTAVWVDIGTKLVERVTDDITAVRETSVKTSVETIFRPWSSSNTRQRNNDHAEFGYLPPDVKQEVQQRCGVLLRIFANLEKLGCGSCFENVLVLIVDSLDDKNRVYMNSMFKLIVGCLFSELLQREDTGDSASITNCIGLIQSFAKASPHLFTQSLMTMLEPYLKASAISDYKALYHAIKIYDTVLPYMKRPDPMFLADTELTLTKLVVNCPVLVLTAAISCLCTICHKLTHNYDIISNIMYGCIEKLRQEKVNVVQLQPISSSKRLVRLCLITGLLCQYCNFDANEHAMDKSGRLRELCQNGIASETFELLYFFAANRVTGEHVDQQSSNQIKLAALQSLGYLYIQYPKYMVTKKSTTMMDEMFASRFLDYKSRVLRVFLDYLVGEEKRIIEREKEVSKDNTAVDLTKLLGNASEMAELSVSSSLMQRYLERILQTALEPNDQLRNLSFKVITRIVQQGLAHPVICMPVIVALETSPDQIMRDKAFQLHFQLNQRHHTVLYSRNVDCVRAAYDYNHRLLGDASMVNGHLGEEFEYEALLQPMYSLIREKRKFRNDFLTSIIKLFDLDVHQENHQDPDVRFYCFIAQNIVGMRYKTIEEPLCIIFAINKVLCTTAMNLMSNLNLEIDLEGENGQDIYQSLRSKRRKQRNETKRLNEEGDFELDANMSAKYCLIMSILLHAKQVLKDVFNLSEEKCQQYHPEESNTFKTKAVTNQPPIPMYNNLLLEFPVFDTRESKDETVDRACKYFAKLMMNDTLGTVSLERDQDPEIPLEEDGPTDIFSDITFRKSNGRMSSKWQ